MVDDTHNDGNILSDWRDRLQRYATYDVGLRSQDGRARVAVRTVQGCLQHLGPHLGTSVRAGLRSDGENKNYCYYRAPVRGRR